MKKLCNIVLFLSLTINYAYTQISLEGLCKQMETCGKCLEAGSGCSWCSNEIFTKDNSRLRCNLASNLKLQGCADKDIVSPKSEIYNDKNKAPRNSNTSQNIRAIQISPQEVTIKLRPNTPYKMNINFKQAENYPVDLYFVMDLSQSMEDDRIKLAELGVQLADNLKQITSDFRIGFGSFVDKETMPYISIIPSDLNSPCKYNYNSTNMDRCASPYSFINQMKLEANAKLFARRVLFSKISGNLDSPEGGFDALMQAIVCNNEIGWRKNSRKMILFATDNDFHLAGDGKLAGIVTPNDGACHMNDNKYTYSLKQDYPSISHIASTVAKNKVNVIFAVTKSQKDLYTQLSEAVEGSVIGILADDSSNVVELVKDNYEKISGKVEMKLEGDEDINVVFRTKCLKLENFVERSFCDGLKIGQNITFEMTIEVKKCPADASSRKRSFSVYPVGLTEKLTINLELLCECDCEKPAFEDLLSDKCSKSGTFECGSCTCDPGSYGKTCECRAGQDNIESLKRQESCKKDDSPRSLPCEGRGNCVCGECECNQIQNNLEERFTGKFCDCNNFNCQFKNGKICSGHGHCECSRCVCDHNYIYSDCSCLNSTDTCVSSKSNKICNGHGTCECGRCSCVDNYSGAQCDICPRCAKECTKYKECVFCMVNLAGREPVNEEETECKKNCTHVKLVDEIEQKDNWQFCQLVDSEDCHHYFIYSESKMVELKREKECPNPLNLWWILFFILLGILLIGLAILLIWKVIVTIHDRREYAKFMNEQANAKYNMEENPIYKNATSKYNNPTYAPVSQNED